MVAVEGTELSLLASNDRVFVHNTRAGRQITSSACATTSCGRADRQKAHVYLQTRFVSHQYTASR